MTPVLRYYGGKARMASWIIEQMPPHYTYVEPFGGAGSVLLAKPPARFEVYNDLDGRIVNFFRVLRENEPALRRAIELTPWSRAENALCAEVSADPLEDARRVYTHLWQSFRPALGRSSGWRYQHSDNGYSVVDQWHTAVHDLPRVARRLRMVQIENDLASAIIPRYDTPNTLFYVDPPYVSGTRYDSNAYSHEMSDEAHCELAEILNAASGMVLLSGYDSDLYRKLYADWRMIQKSVATNGAKNKTECLWLNSAASSASLPMFREGLLR